MRFRHLFTFLAFLVAAGCATLDGDHARKDVAAVAGKWAAAMQEHDLPAMMTTISGTFHSDRWEDRDGLEDFMRHAEKMGYLEGVEIALENSVTVFEQDSAIVSPVEMTGSFGRLDATITLKRDPRAWRIAGLNFSDPVPIQN